MLERERRRQWQLDRQKQEVTKKGDRCGAERAREEKEGKKNERLKNLAAQSEGRRMKGKKAGESSFNTEKRTGWEQCKAGD